MARIQLEAGNDLVQRLAHENDPVQAVIELVWNSLDADAHHVTVTLHRNDADGVIGAQVTDDGHGMAPEELASAFRWVGNSWKLAAGGSKGEGRPLHGRLGQGRLRAFALGAQVVWETVADSLDGRRLRSVIRASAAARNDFDTSDPVVTDEDTGTRFIAMGRDGLDRLAAEGVSDRVTATFAPYLIARQDTSITYDGSRIRPDESIDLETSYELEWTHDAVVRCAKLRIIEWKGGKERAIHLCDGEGVPIDALNKSPAPDFRYSAYVLWHDMPEHHNEWLLTHLETTPSILGVLLAEVEQVLERLFESRRAQRRRELVAEWKADSVYPYEGYSQLAVVPWLVKRCCRARWALRSRIRAW